MGFLDGLFGQQPQQDGAPGLFSNPDALLAIAAQLLQAKKGDGSLGLAIGAGAQAQQQAKARKQQDEMRALQMQHLQQQAAQQKTAMERDQGLRGLQSQFYQPGAPAQPQMGPTPDGSQMPMGAETPPTFNQGGYANAALSKGLMTPMEAVSLQAKERVKVAAGETVGSYGPDGKFKPDYTAQDKPPTGFKVGPNGDWVVDQGWLDAQKKIREAGKTSITVDNRLENREHGDKGALNVKNYGELQASAVSARKENSILSSMERNPVETGKGAPLNATVSAWLAYGGLGGDRAKEVAANSEKFQSAAMDLVLQKQLAQKGPQTESDAKRLEATVASLGNTGAGNAAIIAFSKAANNRTINQERFYADFWKKNRTYEGADNAWYAGEGGTSLWDDAALKKFGGQSGGRVIDFRSLPKNQ